MRGFPNKPKKFIITKSPKGGDTPPGRALLRQALLALIIFLSLVSIYSFVSDASRSVEEISSASVERGISSTDLEASETKE